MIIAVTDACIFIDILDLKITAEFFGLDLEIHTTVDVWNELDLDQQEILKAYRLLAKLNVHILQAEDQDKMNGIKYPKGLSEADKSVIYIAGKLDAMILTSDNTVRNYASSRSIDRHGMLWILDQIVELQILPKNVVGQKLKALTSNNLMYLNNKKLSKEIDKRIKEWVS